MSLIQPYFEISLPTYEEEQANAFNILDSLIQGSIFKNKYHGKKLEEANFDIRLKKLEKGHPTVQFIKSSGGVIPIHQTTEIPHCVSLPINLSKFIDAINAEKHFIGTDHVGINIHKGIRSKETMESTLLAISKELSLYQHSDNEPWFFAMPTTKEEHLNGEITDLSQKRQPKFEIVYESLSHRQYLQIDLETDLKRGQLVRLFPNSFDITNELGEYFRSVMVETPWKEMPIRFDLRYKGCETPNEWNTGELLIQNGQQITPNSKLAL